MTTSMRSALLAAGLLLAPVVAGAQNQSPIANAGPDQTVFLGTSIYLDGTGSYDPDGDPILAWDWQLVSAPEGASYPLFGDNVPRPVFLGTALGEYVLVLTVTDGRFWSHNDIVTITVVENQPPVAVLNATPISGPAPLTVQFDASQSHDPEGMALQYDWEFGDGGASPLPTVSHAFVEPGTYAVYLIVVDAQGARDIATVDITVLPPANNPPVVNPTASPPSGSAALTVQFAANATDADNDPLTYAWDFGDGATSTVANPSHTYTQTGTFTAWLTVSDGKDPVSASLTIVVNPSMTFSIASAKLTYAKKSTTMADLMMTADLTAAVPGPDDVVMVYIDGVRLFAQPFSAFSRKRSLYTLRSGALTVQIDFTARTLTVSTGTMSLSGITPANGLDVEFWMGDRVAVEHIPMTATRTGFIYQR